MGVPGSSCMYHLTFMLSAAYELTGLSRGGQQVSKCKDVFGQAVKLLVKLASLQVSHEVSRTINCFSHYCII